jgi:steroid delta-isomerase-like uncharacterized protein
MPVRMSWFGLLAVVLALGVGGATGGCAAPEAQPALVPSPMPAVAPPLPAPPPPIDDDPRPPPKPVMADAQRKFLSELEVGLAARDAKKVASLYSTGAVLTSAAKEGVHESMGRGEIEAARARGFAVMGKAFPDVKWVHTRALQNGDVMIVEWAGTGTDTGGFLEDKPTNKKVGWRGVSILWFDDDGLVRREHSVLDPLTIMGQLGRGDAATRKVRPPTPPAASPTVFVVGKDSPEEKKNLEAVQAMYPLIAKKDEKALLAMLTDDVVHADLTQPEDVKGKDGIKKELATWLKAFPDLEQKPLQAWAFGDVVVTEIETKGTFKGALGALKPNGKSATTHGVDVIELKDGKIARMTSYANGRELLVQYDLLPAKK